MRTQNEIETRAVAGLPLCAADLARVSRDRRVVTLRRRWMSAESMDARVWDAIRRAVVTLAQSIADKTGRSVEIYAADPNGWLIEAVIPTPGEER